MALVSISALNAQIGRGGAGMQGTEAGTVAATLTEFRAALIEQQGFSIDLVAGAAAATNIAITGIATTDTILSVIHNTAGALVDLTSEASITSAGNIQLSTTDTTGDDLLVFWYNKA